MVTIVFKILLIILIPAPVIAAAVYFYVQMLGFIGERNKAEKRHLKDGSLKVSKGSADKGGKPEKAGKADKARKTGKADKRKQGRKAKGRSSRTE